MNQQLATRAGEYASHVNFTAAGVSPDLPLSLYEEYVRHSVAMFKCSARLGAGYQATVSSTKLRNVEIMEMTCAGAWLERSPELIRSNPCDMVILGIVLSGSAFMHHRSRSDVLGVGDGVLYDTDSPAVCGVSDGYAELEIYVPRETYGARYGVFEVNELRIIRSAATRGAVAAYVDAVTSTARARMDNPAIQADAAEAAAFDLLDHLICGPTNSAVGYWLSARRHIRLNLHDSQLSVGDVASLVGISERHIARVFAGHSTSVKQVIADERLRFARDLLIDPGRKELPISQIAFLAGFASSSQFARAIRKRFGCTARELRAGALVTTPSSELRDPLSSPSFQS